MSKRVTRQQSRRVTRVCPSRGLPAMCEDGGALMTSWWSGRRGGGLRAVVLVFVRWWWSAHTGLHAILVLSQAPFFIHASAVLSLAVLSLAVLSHSYIHLKCVRACRHSAQGVALCRHLAHKSVVRSCPKKAQYASAWSHDFAVRECLVT